jgi:tRNA-specific 2-thiouridylase
VSGGADSAVAAARLADKDPGITGVTMRLVDEGLSNAHDASLQAASDVCDALSIRHRVVDLRAHFDRLVVSTARTLRAAGATPNPCTICNEHVKFGALLDEALTRWADVLATGHYVRCVTAEDGVPRLARPADASKDQTYFLYRVSSAALEYLTFPLAESHKEDVLAEARERGLPTLSRESQDICVPDVFADEDGQAGNIVGPDGETLGTHEGVLRFTVGQRKGLGLPGGPHFVTRIDPRTGDVHVGGRESVFRTRVRAVDPVWNAVSAETECDAQIRYRSAPSRVRATLRDDELHVEFESPIEAPAPGQSVVCYQDDVVIGGGVIAEAW